MTRGKYPVDKARGRIGLKLVNKNFPVKGDAQLIDQTVERMATKDTTPEGIARAMVGRDVDLTEQGTAEARAAGQRLKARGLNVTRLARGVPAGSELEYVDLGTIAHALVDRRTK